jgi:hypothetical protein
MDRTIISRREAHERGLKRFYTGEPCGRGHTSQRFTANGNCTDCQTFKTPKWKQGPKGRNVGWPTVGLVFNVTQVLPEEIEAAFRYMEAMGWHDAAVLEIRKNPALMEKYRIPLKAEEVGMLTAKLERAKRTYRAQPILQDAIVTLTCGHNIHITERIKVGEPHHCKFCKGGSMITTILDHRVG